MQRVRTCPDRAAELFYDVYMMAVKKEFDIRYRRMNS